MVEMPLHNLSIQEAVGCAVAPAGEAGRGGTRAATCQPFRWRGPLSGRQEQPRPALPG